MGIKKAAVEMTPSLLSINCIQFAADPGNRRFFSDPDIPVFHFAAGQIPPLRNSRFFTRRGAAVYDAQKCRDFTPPPLVDSDNGKAPLDFQDPMVPLQQFILFTG